ARLPVRSLCPATPQFTDPSFAGPESVFNPSRSFSDLIDTAAPPKSALTFTTFPTEPPDCACQITVEVLRDFTSLEMKSNKVLQPSTQVGIRANKSKKKLLFY